MMTPAWEIAVSTLGLTCCPSPQYIWFLSISLTLPAHGHYLLSNTNCFSLFGKPWLNDIPSRLLYQVDYWQLCVNWLPVFLWQTARQMGQQLFLKMGKKELQSDTVLKAFSRWQIISWPWNPCVCVASLWSLKKTDNCMAEVIDCLMQNLHSL